MKLHLRLLALLAVFALLTTACGDDSDDSSGGGGDAAADSSSDDSSNDDSSSDDSDDAGSDDSGDMAADGDAGCGLGNGQEATGDPIKVGAVVGATGPADFSSASKATAAYFACVNANGGINGRPIDYQVEDDQWDPAVAATVARGLVEDEGVVAMIGSTSFVECAANADYYEEQNVLVIAGVGVPRECFHSRNISPTNQGPRLSGIGAAQWAVEQGAESLACVSNVIPNFGAWVCEGITAYGDSVGVPVSSFNGAPDLSDAETIVLQAMEADTDAVVVVEPGPGVVGYINIAAAQGDETPWYGPTSSYDLSVPAAVDQRWIDDNFAMQIELVELDSAGPHNTLWGEVMDKYGNDSDPRDSFSQAGLLAALVFVDALLGLDPAAIDRNSVTDVVRAIEGFETDLMCGDWYFGDGDRHQANHAGRIVQIVPDGIGFETIKDCHEVLDPELADILAAEG